MSTTTCENITGPRLVVVEGDGWHEARTTQQVTVNGADMDWGYYRITPNLTPFGEKLTAAVSDLPEQGIPIERVLGHGIRYAIVQPLTWDDADTIVATAFAAANGGPYDVEYDGGDFHQAEPFFWGGPR